MINRELIRLKTIQLVYAHYQSDPKEGAKSWESATKELLFSLDKSYELYHALLMLMQEVHRVAVEDLEQRQKRARQLGKAGTISAKFVNNLFMQKLLQNKQLIDFREANNQLWALEEELVKNIFRLVQQSPFYEAYMEEPSQTFEEDKNLWRSIYKRFICDNEDVESALEDMNLYWNDDKFIIDTFVLKTIKRITREDKPTTPLMEKFASEADKQFAINLMRYSLENEEQYRKLIEENLINWDYSRVALMDQIIMQVALAEIISFPEIPLSVSINEYVNVAKAYSTPRSGAYVNGMLDGIAKKLQAENVLVGK